MTITRRAFVSAAAVYAATAATGPGALAQSSQQQRLVDRARLVVEEFQADAGFTQLPLYVQNAFALLIFPETLKAGFFVGAEYGRGVMLARDLNSGAWSDPAFYELYAGSLGLQFGGKASDLIFTLMNQGAVSKLLDTKFTLGTDASVAAGPLAAGVGAGTTTQFGEDVYIFARGKGLYGGLGVDGTYFQPKSDWNSAAYGGSPTPRAIVNGEVSGGIDAQELKNALNRF